MRIPNDLTSRRFSLNSSSELSIDTRKFLSYACLILLLFGLLSSLRLSTTSLPFSSDGTDDATVLVNKVRMTRSDDFLRGVPRWLSYQQGGTPDSILDYSQSEDFVVDQESTLIFLFDEVLLLPDEVVQSVIETIAPLEVKYSIREWFIYLRAFLVIPLFFILFGYRLSIGIIATAAVAFTPLSLWFGGSAVAMISAVLLPIALARLFVNVCLSSMRYKAVSMILLGLYCGKSAFGAIDYPPWKWPVALVFGTFAIVCTIQDFGLKRLVRPVTLILGVVAIAQIVRWLAYSSQYEVTLDTVYPGQRRAAGGGGYGNPMAGAISWMMQTDDAAANGRVNPEFAFSLNALMWPCALAAPLLIAAPVKSSKSRGFLAALVPLSLLVLWVSTKWPDALLNYNPLTFVTTDRAGQILGVIAILMFALLVDLRPSLNLPSNVMTGALAGVVVLVLSLGDAIYWNNYFHGSKPIEVVWISVSFLSLCVVLFHVIKHPILALLPVLVFSIASSFKVQPLTVGLGPLVRSDLAQSVRQQVREDPQALWGSDPYWGDALTMAQGARMVSGQQPFGPNRKLWEILDPENAHEDIWNRGQSYIHFIWDQNEPGVRMSNPSPDVISVVTAPCGQVMKSIGLRYLLTKENPGSCARKIRDAMWMASPVSIYELDT